MISGLTLVLHLQVIEYYEENLSTRFPYTCYKQVFVDMAYSEIAPYASMTICRWVKGGRKAFYF